VNRSQRQSLKEYNDELVEGNAQIEAGNYFTHEEVKKRFSK
jgi:predicted transcriptional regulator